MKLVHNGKILLIKQEHVVSDKAVLEKKLLQYFVNKASIIECMFCTFFIDRHQFHSFVSFFFLIFERFFSLLESVAL